MHSDSTIRKQLQLRARLNAAIRTFFEERGVLEVNTPILARSGTTDTAIESFQTTPWSSIAPERLWLRTSPEFFHKRLLAAGSGPIFELGPVFRHGELGPRHNPEFTMLEWYRPGFTEAALIDEVVALIAVCADALEHQGVARRAVEWFSYRDLYLRFAQVDPAHIALQELQARCSELGVIGQLERDEALDLLRTHVIEPQLRDRFIVLHSFPPTQAALARIRPGAHGEPDVAARFEIYLDGWEIANGYDELCDATEQAARLQADLNRRSQRGQPQVAIDLHFLDALARGLPQCSGVALGVDRLLLCLIGATSLPDVLAFPFSEV